MAVLLQEPGAEAAQARLAEGAISLVNVAEVAGQLVRGGRVALEALEAVNDLGLRWVQIDGAQVERVAELRAVKHLSLGDRFCIALAEAREEPLVTADRAWARLDLRVPVDLIR